MASPPVAALPYHEPGIITILVLTSFLLLLNAINHLMNHLYIGLLGQIFLGIAFGTPGFALISNEPIIVDLGYLGLLLLVYEGGLTTSFRSLKANLTLSSCVALTGISLPIALSFVLVRLTNATPLQAFAAGAALCSTSLGTTFTVMQTSGLSATRMGVVLTSAAMMDDVVGLVMVQVISNLGRESFSAVTVVRPVFVSIVFGVAVVVGCRYLVLPVMRIVNEWKRNAHSMAAQWLATSEATCVVHALILTGMVTGATYAGTSNLFAAYLAGAGVSWYDGEGVEKGRQLTRGESRSSITDQSARDESDCSRRCQDGSDAASKSDGPPAPAVKDMPSQTTGIAIFEKYFYESLQRILKPFFFASIGFSIPITKMFTGSIVWRGFVYTALMFLAKVVCGLWLVRWNCSKILGWFPFVKIVSKAATKEKAPRQEGEAIEPSRNNVDAELTSEPRVANIGVKIYASPRAAHSTPNPNKPVSLYPPMIVGSAMVARGEIGFLISSLAESNGIFGEEANGPIFLAVTWAIMLCTIVGPIMVGLLVRRVKAVSQGKGVEQQSRILGVWGVSN